MYKKDKCLFETRKQYVSFVMWHFLLTQRGEDLWAADCMNHFCSEKYKSTWSYYENNFLRLERLEVWPSKNLAFKHTPITLQKDGPT